MPYPWRARPGLVARDEAPSSGRNHPNLPYVAARAPQSRSGPRHVGNVHRPGARDVHL
jgi:hypothetical protein